MVLSTGRERRFTLSDVDITGGVSGSLGASGEGGSSSSNSGETHYEDCGSKVSTGRLQKSVLGDDRLQWGEESESG